MLELMNKYKIVCCYLMLICFSNADYYYWSTDWVWSNASTSSGSCPIYGPNSGALASVHSNKEIEAITRLCNTKHYDFPSLCWIGLILNKGKLNNNWHHTNITYSWFDKTDFDININNMWCTDYPVFNDSYNISYTYINGSCWQNTIDPSFKLIQFICGPVLRLPTLDWIVLFYIPIIFGPFGTIVSALICYSLIYNLCYFKHNWAEYEPTTCSKYTAIFASLSFFGAAMSGVTFSLTNYIGFKTTGIVIDRNLPPDSLYPNVYQYCWISIIILFTTVALAILTSYIHIAIRLKSYCDSNEFIKQAVPCKSFFYFVWFLLFLLFPLTWFVMLKNSNISGITDHDIRETISKWCIITIFIDTILINGLLLYVNIKGLHIYGQKCYFQMDDALNDRMHQLMLRATRYTVVYGLLMIFDLLMGIFAFFAFTLDQDGVSVNDWAVIFEIFFILEMMVMAQAIYLSFEFSHATYEKLCWYSNRYIKNFYHNKEQKRHNKMIMMVNNYDLKRSLVNEN